MAVHEPPPPTSSNATIRDVAEHAQVSRAAVSKVIRNAYGVSDDMRERVNRSIKALGYRPRLTARGMRGSTYTIGILIGDYSNQFYGEVMRGISEAITDTPYQLIIALVDNERGNAYQGLENLHDRAVDGVIAITPLVVPAWLDDMADKMPIVQIGRHARSEHYDTIVGDDKLGVRLMMDHLFELGHQKIAHVTHVDPNSELLLASPHYARRHMYETMMAKRSLTHETVVIPAKFEEEASFTATTEALNAGLNSTAIFAGNDDAALGVQRALADAHKDESVSVAGYDDSRFARHPRISLTTIHQSGYEMGKHATRLLLERLEGRKKSEYLKLPVRLVTRSSTKKWLSNKEIPH